MFERERRIVNGKIHSILHVTSFILKDENETSMKVFQEAMIHSCVEVVRETKRQCRILRISAGHNKCENHRSSFVAQLDSAFCSETLEQAEN